MKRKIRNILCYILVIIISFLPLFFLTKYQTLNNRLYGFESVYFVIGLLTFTIGIGIFFIWLLWEDK